MNIIFSIILKVFVVFIAYSSSTPIISSNKEHADMSDKLYPSISQTKLVSDNSDKATIENGWRGIINGNWHKHGSAYKNENRQKSYDHSFSKNNYKKKYEKSDKKDENKKWSKGKKVTQWNEKGSKMEYIKDKGHYYEKHWSWDRESGTKKSYGKERQSNKEHDKGEFNENHSLYHENKQKKMNEKQYKNEINEDHEDWGKSHIDKSFKKNLFFKNYDKNSWWSTPSQRMQTWFY